MLARRQMSSRTIAALLRYLMVPISLAGPVLGLAATSTLVGDRSGWEWMDEGYRRKADHDLAGATEAFEAARARGFDAQRVDLELAFVALERGDRAAARRQLESVTGGPDPDLVQRARTQLSFVPGHLRGDLYWDGYGWRGLAGNSHVANEVPTLRIRAHYLPWLDQDASLYLSAQATRDRASEGGSLPRIYSDNALIVGPGALLPLWGKRVGLFVQAGWALSLIDDKRDRSAFDARGGGYLGLESGGCFPAPASGARLALSLCADLYAEAVWLSRFDHEAVAFGRGRAGAGWLLTGPVAWQVLAEGRAAANRNRASGDPFAEAGIWHRWRLLRPFLLDALVGVNEGKAFGLGGRSPARPGAYTELRFQLTSTVEF